MTQLYFEKLHVYQHAIKFLSITYTLVENMPRGNAAIVDQLKRASLSIVLNIAEGAGKMSRPDARKFYGIARGSSLECSAALDACKVLKIAENDQINAGKALLVEIVKMLSVMCRNDTERPRLGGKGFSEGDVVAKTPRL